MIQMFINLVKQILQNVSFHKASYYLLRRHSKFDISQNIIPVTHRITLVEFKKIPGILVKCL